MSYKNNLGKFLEQISGAILQRYYVNVKNKIMSTNSQSKPFDDTVTEFSNRPEIIKKMTSLGCTDYESRRFIIEEVLLGKIITD